MILLLYYIVYTRKNAPLQCIYCGDNLRKNRECQSVRDQSMKRSYWDGHR